MSEEDHQRHEALLLLDEQKSFISTLPKKTGGWICPEQYQYKGFWFEQIIHGVLAAERHFHRLITNPPKVLLVSYPKSGTTWLKAILFATINRTQFDCSEPSTHPLTKSNPHQLIPFLESYALNHPLNPIPAHASILQIHSPFSLLSNTIEKSKFPIVYIHRNPKDVLVSFWHHANKLRPNKNLPPLELAEAVDMFCNGYSVFGPYWTHVSEYWNAYQRMPERVLFVSYEGLKEAPVRVVKRLTDFLGCPFSVAEEQEGVAEKIISLCGFESLSKLEVNKSGMFVVDEWNNRGFENSVFFRTGEVGDYKNYLTSEMIERVDIMIREKLKGISSH